MEKKLRFLKFALFFFLSGIINVDASKALFSKSRDSLWRFRDVSIVCFTIHSLTELMIVKM